MEIDEKTLKPELARARRAERLAAAKEPRAKTARYDAATGRIVVDLTNGTTFIFPAALGQGLAGAAPEQLAEVEVVSNGYGLHWEKLDADLAVPSLLMGIFGTKAWLSELGRVGGRVRSSAKTAAVRENGKKGGRPRKRAHSG